jgi:hypothetical protein
MISFKKEMEKIEVNSPSDCVWFISEITKCCLPGANKRNSNCHCLNGEMDEMCIWITRFLKSSPNLDIEDLEGVVMPDDLSLDTDNEAMNRELEKAMIELLQSSVPQNATFSS